MPFPSYAMSLATWAAFISLQFTSPNACARLSEVPSANAAPTNTGGSTAIISPNAPLLPWELEAIQFARRSDAWTQRWLPEFLENEEAETVLRRAAFTLRCGLIARHDAPTLVPELREAINTVAEKQRFMLSGYEGPEFERWKHRGAIHAYRQLSESEILLLRAGMASPTAIRDRSWSSAIAVLTDFPWHARPTDGRFDPARIVKLKDYLQAELVWPDIVRAMKAANPRVTRRFLALGPLNQYSLDDAKALRELGDQVSSMLPSAIERINRNMPSWNRKVIDQMIEVQVGAEQIPDPVLSPSNLLPPMPEGLKEKLLRTTSTGIAGELVRQFCPKA